MPTTATFSYPSSAEVTEIDPILMAQEVADDPLLGPDGLFPIRETDADMLIWDQRDSYSGLMQVRGLNGDPPRVKRLGTKRFKVEPGVYGEFLEADEEEMTRRARPGTLADPIEVDDLVMECHDQLLTRQTNRMRWVCAQLLTTGYFKVVAKTGAVAHQDAYPIQAFSAAIGWATRGTATPLADFRQIPILGRGQSTLFGAGAEAWMTRATYNNLIGNQNPNDLAGQRTQYGATVKSLADVNLVLEANDLPMIRLYEYGWKDDVTGAWNTYFPDNVVVYVGRRMNGEPIGEFRMTKNVSAPNFMGAYDKVVTRGMGDNETPPAKIEVHRGFSGGPTIFYPGSIFIMNV